jgi:biotin carboxyl carrier protein
MAGDQEALARLADGELRELLGMVEGTDIEELELEVSGTRLFFKRPAARTSPQAPGAEGEPTPGPGRARVDFILAERVGFFHYPTEAEGPLKPGDEVAAGQVLGVIDSLSVPIPLSSARAGRVEEVLVEEGQPVEFGQPLFVLQPELG